MISHNKTYRLFILTLFVTSFVSLFAQKEYRYNPNANRIEFNNFKQLENNINIRNLKDNIVRYDNKEVIERLFFLNFISPGDYVLIENNVLNSYSLKEKREFLVDMGVLIPLDSFPHPLDTKDLYYTTKITHNHLLFDWPEDSAYVVTGPVFLAPIRPWNTAALDGLVEPNERFLSNKEKLQLLIDRGILKKLTQKDNLKKLNKITITRRYKNREYVDSILKVARENDSICAAKFDVWYETAKDTLQKIHEAEK